MQETVTEVQIVLGVQEPAVSTQYLVVPGSSGVRVTVRSVLLRAHVALSVVVGVQESIPAQ